ncbi:MAG: hypothetical protein KZQ83_01860 [gamma proteobacterium symbiont of Taylorina sp.]|nr:hypothetical protein [gamma proteobacterium symbiont of Taylorina sp.]
MYNNFCYKKVILRTLFHTLIITLMILNHAALADDYTVVSGESIYFDSGSNCGSPAPDLDLSDFTTLPSHGKLVDQGIRYMSLEDELSECGTQTGVQEERITNYTADIGYVGTDEIISTDGNNTYHDFITITASTQNVTPIVNNYTVVSGESIYFDSGSNCGSPAPDLDLSDFTTLPSHGKLVDQGIRYMSLEDELSECGTQTGVQEERITNYTADIGYVGTDEIISTDGNNTYHDVITITASTQNVTPIAEVQGTTGTSFSITPTDADMLTTSSTIPDVGALFTLIDSATTIKRDDGSVIEVKQETVAVLNPIVQTNNSITLIRGEVTATVDCNYEVLTPLANIISCPTTQRNAESATFTANYSQAGIDGTLTVSVETGTVDVTDREGNTFTVTAGKNKTIQSKVPRTSWVLPIDNDKIYGGKNNLFIWTEYPDANSYLLEFNIPEPVFSEENPSSAEFQEKTVVLTSDFYFEYDGLLIFTLLLPKGLDGIVLEVRLFALDKQGNIIDETVASDRSTVTITD